MDSSPEEMQELQERAEQGQQARLAPVSLTMAILAVFVAAVSVLGHRAHTEEVILQNRVTDAWAYYQAKNTQRQTTELFLDLLRISEFKDQKTAEALKDKYQDISKSLGSRQDEIKNEARNLEKEMDVERRRADRFDLGESFLEIALVVTSITLLTRKRLFWGMGFVAAAIGLVIACFGLALH
jgi:Flp pilus assembly protein TadB